VSLLGIIEMVIQVDILNGLVTKYVIHIDYSADIFRNFACMVEEAAAAAMMSFLIVCICCIVTNCS